MAEKPSPKVFINIFTLFFHTINDYVVLRAKKNKTKTKQKQNKNKKKKKEKKTAT